MDDSFVGTLIGELKVVACLGEGETGTVFEAWDPSGERRAVRVFRPELARTPGFFDRLSAISQKLVTLRSPGIAHLYGVGALDDGSPYAVMEYVDGELLSAWLKRKGPAAIAEVLSLGANLCKLLQPLHSRGFVHNAVAAENVFLVSGGRPLELKLIGLGMPRAARPRSTTSLAPEQLKGEPTSSRTDLYALGVLLFRLITGHEPFENDRPREPVPDPRDLRADTPRQLAALVQTLLSVEPSSRPPTADTVGRALSSLSAAPAPSAPRAPAPSNPSRKSRPPPAPVPLDESGPTEMVQSVAPAPLPPPPAPAPRPVGPPPDESQVGDGLFHTTAEIEAQKAEPAPRPSVKALKPARNTDDEDEAPPRTGKIVLAAVVIGAGVIGGIFWLQRSPPPPPPAVEQPVAPKPVAVAADPDPTTPTDVRAAPPTAKELVARARALTQELKQRPSTTYDARTELRKLLKRSEANPDAAERASITEELDQWQQSYLPKH